MRKDGDDGVGGEEDSAEGVVGNGDVVDFSCFRSPSPKNAGPIKAFASPACTEEKVDVA